jgi:hypothetical protein
VATRSRFPQTFACLLVGLLPGTPPARAGSVAATMMTLPDVLARSARVVEGKIVSTAPATVDGATLFSLEVVVDKTLKGPAGKPGEHVRVFDPGQWFAHTHAAAIKGGVISYEDPRYATTVAERDLKKGATLIFFLKDEAPPPGFAAGAVFLYCGQAYDRAEREAEIRALPPAAFDAPVTLKVGGRALLPDGLVVELKGHSHKRPMVGGPQKEMSEVQVTFGKRTELVTVGHVVEPSKGDAKPVETWETRDWDRHRLELVGMKYDEESTLRVRKKTP